MTITDELLRNNERYVEAFDKGDLPMPPGKQIAVVACMDARLNVYGMLGLEEGDAHVIRNAGGVITDDEKIVLVMDNLNIHTPASLYEAFSPGEARRIAEKLEIHYTPKHGSWLNMAEVELSVMGRQCLDRRVPDFESLERESHAWQRRRDEAGVKIDWRFTTDDARIKLKRLYPAFHE